MSPIQEGLLATEEYEDAVEQGYRKALLLAWFASQVCRQPWLFVGPTWGTHGSMFRWRYAVRLD